MTRRWPRALLRGATRRCPRCGRGPLFVRFARMRDACPECGLLYLENPGDPWAFLLVIDRGAFILPPIALIYFGWVPRSVPLIVSLFGALAALVVATTPHRYGLCVALDWLARTRWQASDGGGDESVATTRSATEGPS